LTQVLTIVLAFRSIGRPILLKLMNYSKCMGQVVLSLKDMALSTKLNKVCRRLHLLRWNQRIGLGFSPGLCVRVAAVPGG
jgi:hypothetical protein